MRMSFNSSKLEDNSVPRIGQVFSLAKLPAKTVHNKLKLEAETQAWRQQCLEEINPKLEFIPYSLQQNTVTVPATTFSIRTSHGNVNTRNPFPNISEQTMNELAFQPLPTSRPQVISLTSSPFNLNNTTKEVAINLSHSRIVNTSMSTNHELNSVIKSTTATTAQHLKNYCLLPFKTTPTTPNRTIPKLCLKLAPVNNSQTAPLHQTAINLKRSLERPICKISNLHNDLLTSNSFKTKRIKLASPVLDENVHLLSVDTPNKPPVAISLPVFPSLQPTNISLPSRSLNTSTGVFASTNLVIPETKDSFDNLVTSTTDNVETVKSSEDIDEEEAIAIASSLFITSQDEDPIETISTVTELDTPVTGNSSPLHSDIKHETVSDDSPVYIHQVEDKKNLSKDEIDKKEEDDSDEYTASSSSEEEIENESDIEYDPETEHMSSSDHEMFLDDRPRRSRRICKKRKTKTNSTLTEHNNKHLTIATTKNISPTSYANSLKAPEKIVNLSSLLSFAKSTIGLSRKSSSTAATVTKTISLDAVNTPSVATNYAKINRLKMLKQEQQGAIDKLRDLQKASTETDDKINQLKKLKEQQQIAIAKLSQLAKVNQLAKVESSTKVTSLQDLKIISSLQPNVVYRSKELITPSSIHKSVSTPKRITTYPAPNQETSNRLLFIPSKDGTEQAIPWQVKKKEDGTWHLVKSSINTDTKQQHVAKIPKMISNNLPLQTNSVQLINSHKLPSGTFGTKTNKMPITIQSPTPVTIQSNTKIVQIPISRTIPSCIISKTTLNSPFEQLSKLSELSNIKIPSTTATKTTGLTTTTATTKATRISNPLISLTRLPATSTQLSSNQQNFKIISLHTNTQQISTGLLQKPIQQPVQLKLAPSIVRQHVPTVSKPSIQNTTQQPVKIIPLPVGFGPVSSTPVQMTSQLSAVNIKPVPSSFITLPSTANVKLVPNVSLGQQLFPSAKNHQNIVSLPQHAQTMNSVSSSKHHLFRFTNSNFNTQDNVENANSNCIAAVASTLSKPIATKSLPSGMTLQALTTTQAKELLSKMGSKTKDLIYVSPSNLSNKPRVINQVLPVNYKITPVQNPPVCSRPVTLPVCSRPVTLIDYTTQHIILKNKPIMTTAIAKPLSATNSVPVNNTLKIIPISNLNYAVLPQFMLAPVTPLQVTHAPVSINQHAVTPRISIAPRSSETTASTEHNHYRRQQNVERNQLVKIVTNNAPNILSPTASVHTSSAPMIKQHDLSTLKLVNTLFPNQAISCNQISQHSLIYQNNNTTTRVSQTKAPLTTNQLKPGNVTSFVIDGKKVAYLNYVPNTQVKTQPAGPPILAPLKNALPQSNVITQLPQTRMFNLKNITNVSQKNTTTHSSSNSCEPVDLVTKSFLQSVADTKRKSEQAFVPSPVVPIVLGKKEKLYHMSNEKQKPWTFLPNMYDKRFLASLGYDLCMKELKEPYFNFSHSAPPNEDISLHQHFEAMYSKVNKKQTAVVDKNESPGRVLKVLEVYTSDEDDSPNSSGNHLRPTCKRQLPKTHHINTKRKRFNNKTFNSNKICKYSCSSDSEDDRAALEIADHNSEMSSYEDLYEPKEYSDFKRTVDRSSIYSTDLFPHDIIDIVKNLVDDTIENIVLEQTQDILNDLNDGDTTDSCEETVYSTNVSTGQLRTESDTDSCEENVDSVDPLSISINPIETVKNTNINFFLGDHDETMSQCLSNNTNVSTSHAETENETNVTTCNAETENDTNVAIGHQETENDTNDSTGHQDTENEINVSTDNEETENETNASTGHQETENDTNASTGHRATENETNDSTILQKTENNTNVSTGYQETENEANVSTDHQETENETKVSTDHAETEKDTNVSTGSEEDLSDTSSLDSLPDPKSLPRSCLSPMVIVERLAVV